MEEELNKIDKTLEDYNLENAGAGAFNTVMIEQTIMPRSDNQIIICWRVWRRSRNGKKVIVQYGRTMLEAITGFNTQYFSKKNYEKSSEKKGNRDNRRE